MVCICYSLTLKLAHGGKTSGTRTKSERHWQQHKNLRWQTRVKNINLVVVEFYVSGTERAGADTPERLSSQYL